MILWLGPFFINPIAPAQRSIRASIASIVLPPGTTLSPAVFSDPSTFRQERLVTFAAGDLPALTISRLFMDGLPAKTKQQILTTKTFTLDFSRQQSCRLEDFRQLDGSGKYLRAFLLGGTFPPMAQSACIGLSVGKDPFDVIVPVNEMLRWCYGSSSTMLQTVLSGTLENVLNTVSSSAVRSGSTYELKLPQDFTPQDAQTLAWLATDPHARAEALRIDLSVMANKGKVSTHPDLCFPTALFPYRQQQTLEFLGRWVHLRGSPHPPRFLVSQIIGSDFRSDVQASLSEAEYGPEDPSAPPVDPQLRSPPPRQAADAVLHSEEQRVRDAKPVRLRGLPSQFSKAPPLRHPELRPPAPPSLTQGPAARPHNLTTSPGTDSDSVARAATLIYRTTSGGQDSEPQPAPSARTGFPENVQDLRNTLALLTDVTIHHLPEHTSTSGLHCLTVECRRNGVSCYLFERDRGAAHAGDSVSLLITRAPDGHRLSDAERAALLNAQVKHRGWKLPGQAWRAVRLPHSFRNATTLSVSLQRALDSLFTSRVSDPQPPGDVSDDPVDHQHSHLTAADPSL